MSESSSRTPREVSAEASEIKNPIMKLKEEVAELKELISSLVERVVKLEGNKKELLSSLVERIVKLEGNKENIKPSDNKPNITDANYNNRRSAYISKLNNKDIKQTQGRNNEII